MCDIHIEEEDEEEEEEDLRNMGRDQYVGIISLQALTLLNE